MGERIVDPKLKVFSEQGGRMNPGRKNCRRVPQLQSLPRRSVDITATKKASAASLSKARKVRSPTHPRNESNRGREARWLLRYPAWLRAGAIYLPLDTPFQINEIEDFTPDVEARLIVWRPERGEAMREMCAKRGWTAR